MVPISYASLPAYKGLTQPSRHFVHTPYFPFYLNGTPTYCLLMEFTAFLTASLAHTPGINLFIPTRIQTLRALPVLSNPTLVVLIYFRTVFPPHAFSAGSLCSFFFFLSGSLQHPALFGWCPRFSDRGELMIALVSPLPQPPFAFFSSTPHRKPPLISYFRSPSIFSPLYSPRRERFLFAHPRRGYIFLPLFFEIDPLVVRGHVLCVFLC